MIENDREKKGAIEAILFAMGESVPISLLCEAIQANKKETQGLLQEMMLEYKLEKRGIRIVELEDRYQMCSAPDYYQELIQIASKPKKHNLSDAMMEVLAIVVYQQPVTKSTIEKIRGVRSDHAVNKLVEYGLIEEKGRLEAPGRPILFGSTEDFLRRFGFSSLKQIPELDSEKAEKIGTLEQSEKAEDLNANCLQIPQAEIWEEQYE